MYSKNGSVCNKLEVFDLGVEGYMFYDVESKDNYVLNGTAKVVFDLCENNSIEEICDSFYSFCDDAPERDLLILELAECLSDLLRCGLIIEHL